MANYCFVAPLLAGGEQRTRDWVEKGIRGNNGHDSVFRAAGVTREQVWFQTTPHGDFAVVSLEVKDPATLMDSLASSEVPWAKEFAAFLEEAHGLDISQAPPPNELLVDWREGRGVIEPTKAAYRTTRSPETA
jgi:hypothetical protein